MDSRPRQKHSGMTFLRRKHPSERPSHGKKVFGGMTKSSGNDGLTILSSSRMRGPIQ
jgi:hypothetical protein